MDDNPKRLAIESWERAQKTIDDNTAKIAREDRLFAVFLAISVPVIFATMFAVALLR